MLFNLDTLTGILLTVYVLVLSVFMIFASYRLRNKKSQKGKLFKRFVFQLKENTQVERADLLILYSGFIRRTGFQWTFVRFLEELCFYLSVGATDEDNTDGQKEEFVGPLYEKIKEIHEAEKRVEPFDGLDDSTKNLLSDISKGVTMNDKEYVDSRLTALSLVIKENENKYHKDHSINRWSLGLAIFGLGISLILGYVTLTKKASISDSDMQTITETIERLNTKDGTQPLLRESPLEIDVPE